MDDTQTIWENMMKVFSTRWGRSQKESRPTPEEREVVWGNATGNKIIFKWVNPLQDDSKLVIDYRGQLIAKEIVRNEENKRILSIRSIKMDQLLKNSKVECLAVDSEIKMYNVELCWKGLELDGSLPKGAFRVDARDYQHSNIYVGRKFCEGVGRVELKGNQWTFISHDSMDRDISFGFEVLCNNWK